MSSIHDRIGKRYGRLTIISLEKVTDRMVKGNKHGNSYYYSCLCDCGNYCIANYSALASGNKKSCGCLVRETVGNNFKTHGLSSRKSPEYRAYIAMRDRCYCKSSNSYIGYGDSGIKVCNRWMGVDGYPNFLKDMGKKPTPKHSLDRIDNSKGYSPENCRWASPIEQANNKTSSLIVEYRGEKFTLPNLLRHLDISMDNYKTIYARLKRGWSVERACDEPI